MAGDQTQGFGEIVFVHRGLEVGEGSEVGLALTVAPFHEQAEDQAAHHPKDSQALDATHPTTLVIERRIQALTVAVFDLQPCRLAPATGAG